MLMRARIANLLPGGIRHVVKEDDAVASLNSGASSGSVVGNKVSNGGLRGVEQDLVVHHVKAGHEREGEDEVCRRTCKADEDALPARVRSKFAGIAGVLFVWILARHLNVAAEGQQADAVVGIAALEAPDALSEADGEDLDADAAKFCNGEVAELVDDDHDAEDHKHRERSSESEGHKF